MARPSPIDAWRCWSASMPVFILLNDHSLPSYLASRLPSRPRAAANMVARSVRDMFAS